MNRAPVTLGIIFTSIHATFVALSYSATLLSSFAPIIDPLVAHRVFMLLQFVPLLIIINTIKLSRSKSLLFLTFAICISTLYIVDDFNTGFYGAAVDYKTGIVPRMRTSAHLIAYGDSGRLLSLDYHGEYFLEFVLVHFLSEIVGLNYIFTYFFVIRALAIIIWAVLFVWSSTLVRGSGRRLWILLLASSIMLANQSYNREMSFAPVLLLVFYLTARKQRYWSFTFLALLVGFATLLASFRETQLLGLVSLITLCVIPWNKIRRNIHYKPSAAPTSFNATILVLVFARTFLLTSQEYFRGYANRLFALIDQIWAVLKGSWALQEPLLVTLEGVQNPLDRDLALMSVIFAVSLLVLIAILSIRLVLKQGLDPFSLAISSAYVIALFIPISAYIVQKVTGSGPMHDFGSITVLARSLAPLAVLVIVPYSQNIRRRHFPAKKSLLILVMVYLSLTLIYASFIFSRKETKSSYDMLRVSGDSSEYAVLGNHMYEFVISYVPPESGIRILSPATGFLQHYYFLPLQYVTNKQIETGAMSISLESKIFDNGIFTVSNSIHHTSIIFLNEQNLTRHW